VDKWISIVVVTAATTVAACTVSQPNFHVQPLLSLDGKAVTDNGTAEYEKGKVLLSQERFAVAAQAFQAALFADGSSVKILNALAVSYDELGRYDLADHYYQSALALDPNNPQTANNLAASLAQRGAPDIAAKVLAGVQANYPGDKTIETNLKRAQTAANVALPTPTAALFPLAHLGPPQVPRIEQTSPSTQELITIRTIGGDDKLPQVLAAADINREIVAMPLAEAVETSVHATAESVSRSTVVSETPAPSVVIVKSATVKKIATDGSQRSGDTPRTVAHEAITNAPTKVASLTHPVEGVPIVHEQATLVFVRSRLRLRIAKNVNIQPANLAPLVHDRATLVFARSHLGLLFAESANIQPLNLTLQRPNATAFPMERAVVRLEVANGAGRCNEGPVTYSRSFDHVQTISTYRDEFRLEALELASALSTKAGLQHVANCRSTCG
jgi:Tetratricopeptide repeat